MIPLIWLEIERTIFKTVRACRNWLPPTVLKLGPHGLFVRLAGRSVASLVNRNDRNRERHGL